MAFTSSSNFGRVLKPEAQAKKTRCYSFACASGFNNANLELLFTVVESAAGR
jgi:hypothetical protein